MVWYCLETVCGGSLFGSRELGIAVLVYRDPSATAT